MKIPVLCSKSKKTTRGKKMSLPFLLPCSPVCWERWLHLSESLLVRVYLLLLAFLSYTYDMFTLYLKKLYFSAVNISSVHCLLVGLHTVVGGRSQDPRTQMYKGFTVFGVLSGYSVVCEPFIIICLKILDNDVSWSRSPLYQITRKSFVKIALSETLVYQIFLRIFVVTRHKSTTCDFYPITFMYKNFVKVSFTSIKSTVRFSKTLMYTM